MTASGVLVVICCLACAIALASAAEVLSPRSARGSTRLFQSLGEKADEDDICSIKIASPMYTNVVLSGVNFTLKVTLPPYISEDEQLPETIYYRLYTTNGSFMFNQNVHSFSRSGMAGPTFTKNVLAILDGYGHHDLHFDFSHDAEFTQTICEGHYTVNFLAIPGIVTLLPPILTAVIAILFRQVLIALLLGIWLCAFLANRYNPLTATLRTVDMYFVNSVADFEHSQIAVFSFFLGGLIGVIQKSGGGLGLAAMLERFTHTRRWACVSCVVLGACIFFDDYSLVLIAGTSLRPMMDAAHVSREKFAYILKSLGPTLPSIVPISSWIGVQVGNLQMALDSEFCRACPNLDMDPFVLTVSTIPYRFFPLLLIFSILLITFSNRDFGPILTAERKALPTLPTVPRNLINTTPKTSKSAGVLCPKKGGGPDIGSDSETEKLELRGSAGSLASSPQPEFEGPLAPKKGVKYRWFNAVIPFLITMVITLVGMILDGWQKIKNMPDDENKLSMNVINIFTEADSVAALIWASALACVVSLVMLLIQRILTLNEYMTAWMEGVKDIIEPYMVLWLAWALGAAIQDIQTTNFLAKAMNDIGLHAKYIPVIVTIIGFAMSFAAGSAFGTMGIIFPLVIPTVCSISNCNKDNVLQSSAAILASSLFGNVISPIAGICILTVFASQCPLERHIKSAALYVTIIASVSLLFGTLPVGAGWYPWYEAWIVMAVIMVCIFVLFSSNSDSLASFPLVMRLFPPLYSAPPRWVARGKSTWKESRLHDTVKALSCSCKCWRKRKGSSPDLSDPDHPETTRLL